MKKSPFCNSIAVWRLYKHFFLGNVFSANIDLSNWRQENFLLPINALIGNCGFKDWPISFIELLSEIEEESTVSEDLKERIVSTNNAPLCVVY